MQVFTKLNDWIKVRNSLPAHATLGFVPTMGNLHAGHASLFLASSKDNEYTVSSVFINPTQFNKADDFTNYPQTLDADIELMDSSGVDFCIIPNQEEIYADQYTYQIQENQFSQLMEGKHRPGHFNGVLTVVMKLLNVTCPQKAYFGEKDYQQYLLIKGMVKALLMNVEIKSCPTVREASGLAFSSRNNRLTQDQRIVAEQFAQIFHQDKPCGMIIKELTAKGIQVDYIEEYQNRKYAAVLIGEIRLIDNFLLP
jgi:pantoate--beta-alanine ligase